MAKESKTYTEGNFSTSYGEKYKGGYQDVSISYGNDSFASGKFKVDKEVLVQRHYSKAWEKFGFPPLNELASEIADTMRKGFTIDRKSVV